MRKANKTSFKIGNKANSKFTPEMRERVLLYIAEGSTQEEVAVRAGVSSPTIISWRKDAAFAKEFEAAMRAGRLAAARREFLKAPAPKYADAAEEAEAREEKPAEEKAAAERNLSDLGEKVKKYMNYVRGLMGDAVADNEAALRLLEQSYRNFLTATADVEFRGLLVPNFRGEKVANPAEAVASRAHRQIVTLLGELGLTAKSRAKLKKGEAEEEEEETPLDNFLKGFADA